MKSAAVRKKIERLLIQTLKELNAQELRETADFVSFLKTRSRIDPSQAYFWTSQWQAMEQHIQHDKRRGHTLGKGDPESLLRALKS